MIHVGIDIGQKNLGVAAIDDHDNLIFAFRTTIPTHYKEQPAALFKLVKSIRAKCGGDKDVAIWIEQQRLPMRHIMLGFMYYELAFPTDFASITVITAKGKQALISKVLPDVNWSTYTQRKRYSVEYFLKVTSYVPQGDEKLDDMADAFLVAQMGKGKKIKRDVKARQKTEISPIAPPSSLIHSSQTSLKNVD
jgi:hypothetical protein